MSPGKKHFWDWLTINEPHHHLPQPPSLNLAQTQSFTETKRLLINWLTVNFTPQSLTHYDLNVIDHGLTSLHRTDRATINPSSWTCALHSYSITWGHDQPRSIINWLVVSSAVPKICSSISYPIHWGKKVETTNQSSINQPFLASKKVITDQSSVIQH